MTSPRVVASVLTWNRRDLLRQALAALSEQTREVDELIVVDNASTDGTPEMLRHDFPDVRLIALAENQGGAGGYCEAIRAGYLAGADWVWLMDDDTIPSPTALEGLVAAVDTLSDTSVPQLLCSRVEWRDGNPHPMNRPVVRRREPDALVDSLRLGFLPVRAATLVSLFLSRDAIATHGLPPRHFFFQADDIEYTAGILRNGRGYYVPGSVVEHRTPTKHTAVDDDLRFYYHARNTIFMLRGASFMRSEKPTLVWFLLWTSLSYLRQNAFKPGSVRNLATALLDGLRFELPPPELVSADGGEVPPQ